MSIFHLVQLIFIFLNFCYFPTEAVSKVVCEEGKETIIELDTDELIFFETANYPSILDKACNMTFVATKDIENITNLQFVISFTNGLGIVDMYCGTTVGTCFNDLISADPQLCVCNNITKITLQPDIKRRQAAFQGNIYLNDWNSGCPLESIARVNPFMFEDETQIILLSTYFPKNFNYSDNKECLWHFQVPENYMFKFFMNKLKLDNNNETFEILNGNSDQLYIATGNGSSPLPPLYFDERYITISYKHFAPQLNRAGIHSYISITKIIPTINGGDNCIIEKTDNTTTTIWNIFDYQNNIECSYNFTVPYGIEVHLTFNKFFIEKSVDTLKFYSEGSEYSYVNKLSAYTFTSQRSGYYSSVMAKFKSDGSIQYAGFEAKFEEIECKCRPPIVLPCNDETKTEFNFMGNTDGSYCSNFFCSISLIKNTSCPFLYYQFSYFLSESVLISNDSFIIFSNDYKIFEMTLDESSAYSVLILSSNKTIIQLHTQSKTFNQRLKIFKLYFIAIDKSLDFTYPEVFITPEKPFYILELTSLPAFSVVTISLDKNLIESNDILEVYALIISSHFSSYFAYYGNRNLSILLETLVPVTVLGISPKYIAENHTLTVFVTKKNDIWSQIAYGDVIFFRALKSHSKGCRFTNNFFAVKSFETPVAIPTVAMLSKEDAECKIHMFSNPDYIIAISHIFTTARNDTCQVYAGNLLDKPLFEFHSSNAHILQAILLPSRWYTIMLPPSSSLFILTHDPSWDSDHEGEIFINNYPFQSFWTPAYYGTDSTPAHLGGSIACNGTGNFRSYKIGESVRAYFTVLSFNFSSDFNVVICYSNTSTEITHIGQVLSYTNATITIRYSLKTPKTNHHAVIGIDTRPKNKF